MNGLAVLQENAFTTSDSVDLAYVVYWPLMLLPHGSPGYGYSVISALQMFSGR